MTHKVGTLEEQLDKLESKLGEAKSATEETAQHRDANEGLLRKIALLESELDTADKNLRETTDRCVPPPAGRAALGLDRPYARPRTACGRPTSRRNTLSDRFSGWSRSGTSASAPTLSKSQGPLTEPASHSWEAKYEEAQAKFAQSKRELEELASQLEGL